MGAPAPIIRSLMGTKSFHGLLSAVLTPGSIAVSVRAILKPVVRRRVPPSAALALGLLLAPALAAAEGAAPAPAEAPPGVRTVLSTGKTVTGETIRYPSATPARITAVEITLAPGQQTGWHVHPVPLFGYVLEGELTVDYGPLGKRVYRQGDGLAEAMNQAHNGRNTGSGVLRILAVFMGARGVPDTTRASPPKRD
jgi:quercetin dioxygenase-like cupin family protein